MLYPIVITKQGPVRGLRMKDYDVFRGVPYAAPPVGSLRFMPPAPALQREAPLDCFAFRNGPIQHQPRPGSFYQKEFYFVKRQYSEDCLFVNVWKPLDAHDCPVMVWFHGGGFGAGSADELPFDGAAYVRQGCMLVTVGFRINLFSSFCYPDSPYRGNLGLKDAVAALAWIRDNIAAFGGDPENVTIFGQSAGGALVASIMACRKADGLYHKAILQSTGGINSISNTWSIRTTSAYWKRLLDTKQIGLEEWLNMDPFDIQAVTDSYRENEDSIDYYPVVDGEWLMQTPGEAIHNGDIPDIPYMTGSVTGDYFFETVPLKATASEQNKAFADRFPKAEKPIVLENDEQLAAFHRAVERVRCYGSPVSLALVNAQRMTHDTYVYGFDHLVPGTKDCRGFHSCELWYVFGTLSRSWRPYASYDRMLSEFFVKSWTSFARNGVPNGGHGLVWKPFTAENNVYMSIDDLGQRFASFADEPYFMALINAKMTEHEVTQR